MAPSLKIRGGSLLLTALISAWPLAAMSEERSPHGHNLMNYMREIDGTRNPGDLPIEVRLSYVLESHHHVLADAISKPDIERISEFLEAEKTHWADAQERELENFRQICAARESLGPTTMARRIEEASEASAYELRARQENLLRSLTSRSRAAILNATYSPAPDQFHIQSVEIEWSRLAQDWPDHFAAHMEDVCTNRIDNVTVARPDGNEQE